MLPKPLRVLWGDLSNDEVKKFGVLAATYFLIIGSYWMLKVMKDGVFDLFVGYEWQPVAKIVSLVFIGIIVMFYSKLVDLFSTRILFYIVCLFYGISFLVLAYFIRHSDPILMNDMSIVGKIFSWVPGKVVGWCTYLLLESFGSIVTVLFWSFVASVTTVDSAKRGYGMIMSCTQIGTILGAWFVTYYFDTLGLPTLFGIGAILVCLVPLLIEFYLFVIPYKKSVSKKKSRRRTGFLEGLRLLFSKSYLMGILVVATACEVISIIVEYQMGMCIKEFYPAKLDGGASFAWFIARNGMAVGFLTLIFSLVGTSFFMRKFGLKFCLISFPIAIGITVAGIFSFYLSSASHYQLLWVFFVAVVLFKGMNFALNIPTKEVMYIPTSRDIRFKTKGWIDAFGLRGSKALGALVTGSLGVSLSTLVFYGTMISLGVVGGWIIVAAFVGNTFERLQQENKIVK